MSQMARLDCGDPHQTQYSLQNLWLLSWDLALPQLAKIDVSLAGKTPACWQNLINLNVAIQ